MFERLKAVAVANGHEFHTVGADAETLAGVAADLSLPPSVAALYADSGPADGSSVPWVIEDLLLFSARELVEAQEG